MLVLVCLCVFGSQLTVSEGVWSLVLGQHDTCVGSRQFPLNPDKELLREAKRHVFAHVNFQYSIIHPQMSLVSWKSEYNSEFGFSCLQPIKMIF